MHLLTTLLLLLLALSGHGVAAQCGGASISLRKLVAISGDLLTPKGRGGDENNTEPPTTFPSKRLGMSTLQDNDRCCPATTTLVQNQDSYFFFGQTWYALHTVGLVQMKSTVRCNRSAYRCCWWWYCICDNVCSPATSRFSVLVTLFNPDDGIPTCVPLSHIAFKLVEMQTHCKCQSP